MKISKTALAAAVAATLGTVGMVSTASAIDLGYSYTMNILATPIGATPSYGATYYKAGRDGAWNSTFTFGQGPGTGSNGMTDNSVLVSGLGSSVDDAGSTIAGTIGMDIALDGSITVTSFSVDTIFSTAGGDFAQYVVGGLAQMSGSVSGAGNNAMSFTPTGRRGSINAPVMNADFNIDNFTVPSATTWQSLSTGSATAYNALAVPTTINGTVFTPIAGGFTGVLVTGGQIGSGWGDFFGAMYFETWKVNLMQGAALPDVPVPAAAWLFGSGLIGLVGVARRRKA